MKEKVLKTRNGMTVLFLILTFEILSMILIIFGGNTIDRHGAIGAIPLILGIIGIIGGGVLSAGLKIIKPQEALVLTLFGKYYGTLKGEGFFFVNPFVAAFNPASPSTTTGSIMKEAIVAANTTGVVKSNTSTHNKKISLKAMTLNNDKQKINDLLGNPIVIGVVVIWKVVNTAQAAFCVDNYTEFLSIQTDSALRDIVRTYPYDSPEGEDEYSLRGSSQEVANKLKDMIQSRVNSAGLEIIEARITQLAYAPEIASAMLQRQQATAIIEARQKIVEGAVGMVEMALDKLAEGDVVQLDEERKAAMVSNLLVVLCGNKDPQPIVNSGSIY